jgi:hypothetical protein
MKSIRSFGIPFLAMALMLLVSACQKKTETTVDSMTDTTSMSAESPYPVEETPPAATTTPPPSRTTTQPRSGSTKPSTSSSTTTSANSVRIPAGTTFDVAMITPVDTRTSNVGETIEAKLTAPLVVNGKVVAEQDATVRGTISALQRASKSNDEEDRASVKFRFTSLETVGGTKSIDATVTNSEGRMVAKSTSTRDKLIIGGSTVAGAVIGKVAGKSTKSTIIGAVGGAVVGTGVVLAAKGYELEVPAGSKVTLRLDDPVTVVMR